MEKNKYFKQSNIFLRFLNRIPKVRNMIKIEGFPDSLSTGHNKSFFYDDTFKKCYQLSVDKVGFDYRIPYRVHQILWAIDSTKKIDGEVVEFGTGKGFCMLSVAKYLDLIGIKKNIFLYDIFLKYDQSKHGKINHTKYYANGVQEVKNNFSQFKNVQLIEGDIYKTLDIKSNLPSRISFAHIDLNSLEPELFVLNKIWEKCQNGSIIIFDDYANRGHEEQYDGINKWFSAKKHKILSTPSGQGIVIKNGL